MDHSTNIASSLFLLDSLTAIGGSERKAVRIINELSERGNKVHLGYLNFPDTLTGEVRDTVSVLYLNRKGKFDFKVVRNIKNFIRFHHVKRLFCMNLYPSLYGLTVNLCLHDSDIKSIVLINKNNFVPRIEELKMVVYRPLFNKASRLIFGCQSQQDRWIKRYRLDRNRCSFIHNGVDCSWFSPEAFDRERKQTRKQFGFDPDDFVISTVAAFLPKKKQDDLIAACAKLLEMKYPVRLALAGDGPTKSSLVRKAKELRILERVHFLGQLMDVRPLLSASDIFALSSVAENFSNAALEAMAMGKPVVLSRVGGAAEMVTEGANGFLYPPSNTSALVSKLKILIDDIPCRMKMGLHARKLVENQFSFSHMIDGYERLLDF